MGSNFRTVKTPNAEAVHVRVGAHGEMRRESTQERRARFAMEHEMAHRQRQRKARAK